jgi:hypothetical protein
MAGKSRHLKSIVINIMINFNKLNSQFNIKDINLTELTRALEEHQDSLIKFALIMGSLLMVGVIFNNYRIKEQNLRFLMSRAQEKLEVLNARDAAVQNLNNFKSSLSKNLNESELITLISNYAKSHHVTIISLSPAESKDMGLYDIISISFEAVSDNFKDMTLFLRKIEKSNFPLRVESWSGHKVEGKIAFSIELSAVLIHT